MRRPFLSLAVLIFATVGTTMPACSIRGIADGKRPVDADTREADGGADGGPTDLPCTADLAHDQANCGRCGRACSGSCDEGTCDVATIADGQTMVAALATNGAFVAWNNGTKSLRACPVQGCTAPVELIGGFELTGQLVIDGDVLFYTTGRTSYQGVGKCTVPACDDDVSLGHDLGLPNALAVDQGDVFVLDTSGRRVIHCGNGRCWDTIAGNTAADGAIALGLTNVYWSVLDVPGAIYTCPRSGCDGESARVFASGVKAPRALTVDIEGVRWTSFEEGTVSSCPLAGCDGPPKVLASGQKNPLGIASDGKRVYWANAGDGTVVSCEVAACAGAPEVLVRGLDRPQWVALDATHVYFATAGGVIGRTPK